jgi:tetratricopeptide (TPR) repeat protein
MEHEGGGPASPFFPSSAKTNVGGIIPANFFMDSERCADCHRDIYEQWRGSMHHFASFNNQFYRKSIEYMQSVVGTKPSRWCAGCHDHALFFNGRFDTPIAEQIDTPEAHAGLACTSCHAIQHVEGSMGNGGFTIAYPPLHDLLSSRNRVVRGLDSFLTYLDPEPHRKTFMKPFMRLDSAEFCAACHKVHLDIPVNQYRWFRGFNDYDAWQASGVSGQGARSFYYPEKSSTCVDCHMPLVPSREAGHHGGQVHSHRFAAANTAVPFVNKDAEQLKATEAFLKSGFVTVDIFAATPVSDLEAAVRQTAAPGAPLQAQSTFAVGEEADAAVPIYRREVDRVMAPLDAPGIALPRGAPVRVDVVVRTRKIGHFFPGGTVDAFDVWLEVQARDASGRVIFWSGNVEDEGRGPVDSGAHFYRSLQLDAAGNPIDKRNAWQSRSLMYVRLIPPGAADAAHFRMTIPPDAVGPVTITAKLNYRKFAHAYTQFAYAGQPKPGQSPALLSADANSLEYTFDPANIPANVSGQIRDRIPDLPIVVVAEAVTTVPLADPGSTIGWRIVSDAATRERWNDWGIGLLLQGDLNGAVFAFTQVTKAEPGYADGWLNVARAFITSGDTDAAKPFLEEAVRLGPSLARVHYFRALVQKADGDYDEAIASLRRVEASYPRDRVSLNEMARILLLGRRYREALAVLERVAAVDPEDLQMHYTAMLCYRGLGDDEQAAREEQLFRRFKADETSTAIAGARARAHPHENNERQAVHDHLSVQLPKAPSGAAPPRAISSARGQP